MPQAFDTLTFHVDHIIARKHGGDDIYENAALACFGCNNHKGPNIAGLDASTGEIVRLYHPRRDAWDDHFRWDGSVLIGRTPIGRVTIQVLEINRDHRLALRQSLILEGVFPPGS